LSNCDGTWHIDFVITNTLLSRSDIELLSGASKRTISRHAEKGLIPGAYRHDKLHWHFPDSPELRAWCNKMGGNKGTRRKKPILSHEHATLALRWLKSHPELAEGKMPRFAASITKEQWQSELLVALIFKHFTTRQILKSAGCPAEVLKDLKKIKI
jgi:hypothetical protein